MPCLSSGSSFCVVLLFRYSAVVPWFPAIPLVFRVPLFRVPVFRCSACVPCSVIPCSGVSGFIVCLRGGTYGKIIDYE